jgi:hypothetical protein
MIVHYLPLNMKTRSMILRILLVVKTMRMKKKYSAHIVDF